MTPLYEIRTASKSFRDPNYRGSDASRIEALRDVSLTVGREEFVAITGKSGSGKSTLLHLMAGLDIPSTPSSKILLHVPLDGSGEPAKKKTKRGKGEPKQPDDGTETLHIHSMSEDERARMRATFVGFVFQSYQLLPALKAWQNVALPLLFTGIDAATRRERAVEALQRTGMAERADHLPGQLSGGQQQRVALARAIVMRPLVLLADEPTGSLDEETSATVLRDLRDLHERDRTTIVIVTHDPAVAKIARRRITLADGHIVGDGS